MYIYPHIFDAIRYTYCLMFNITYQPLTLQDWTSFNKTGKPVTSQTYQSVISTKQECSEICIPHPASLPYQAEKLKAYLCSMQKIYVMMNMSFDWTSVTKFGCAYDHEWKGEEKTCACGFWTSTPLDLCDLVHSTKGS